MLEKMLMCWKVYEELLYTEKIDIRTLPSEALCEKIVCKAKAMYGKNVGLDAEQVSKWFK